MSTSPAIRDGRPPIAPESLRPELHPRRGLAALVLGLVDERDHLLDNPGVELLEQFLARAIEFDVRLEHGIEDLVRRDRVRVALIGAELRARSPLDRRLRHALPAGALVEVAREAEHV